MFTKISLHFSTTPLSATVTDRLIHEGQVCRVLPSSIAGRAPPLWLPLLHIKAEHVGRVPIPGIRKHPASPAFRCMWEGGWVGGE
jgi:hypothetical protein